MIVSYLILLTRAQSTPALFRSRWRFPSNGFKWGVSQNVVVLENPVKMDDNGTPHDETETSKSPFSTSAIPTSPSYLVIFSWELWPLWVKTSVTSGFQALSQGRWSIFSMGPKWPKMAQTILPNVLFNLFNSYITKPWVVVGVWYYGKWTTGSFDEEQASHIAEGGSGQSSRLGQRGAKEILSSNEGFLK